MNWNFWKTNESETVVEPQTATRSSARVQMALLLMMEQMLMEFEQKSNLPAVPVAPEMSEHLRELELLGFTNASQLEGYKAQMAQWQQKMDARTDAVNYIKNAKKVIETLQYARRQFGPDTLLIRFDDFERLMDKYNLVCGTFDRYKGGVPLEKMADISKILEQMRGYRKPIYVNRLRAVESYEIINHFDGMGLPDYLNRFPFVKSNGFLLSTNDFHGNSTWDFDRGYRLSFGKETNLFICAPERDMEKLKRIVTLRNYNDPFICAHTDYGILVFTRWGEEAGRSPRKQVRRGTGSHAAGRGLTQPLTFSTLPVDTGETGYSNNYGRL